MIVLLNPVFNFSKSLLSFSADRATNGTYNLLSVILKFAFVGLLNSSTAGSASESSSFVALLVNRQFLDQIKAKNTLQLSNSICNVRQNCLNIRIAQQL